MKNKLLVALAVMLAFSMVFAGCSSNDVDDDAMPSISQDTSPDENANTDDETQKEYVELTIEYTVTSDGKAEVTGFSGTGNRATIVSEYEGCKVVGIAASAFEDCSTLESVLFWADVEDIGDAAFKNCTALIEIGIPTETIYIGNHAFADCTSLKDLIIWGAPDIGDYAFAGCSSIDEISISANTKSVGAHAFEGCTGAESLIIWGVETIGDYAFAGCSGIEEVSIPHEVRSVGAHAFDGCTSLTSVTVWDDNTQFGVNAFMNCPKLVDKPIEDDENEVIPPTSQPIEDTTDDKNNEIQDSADSRIIMPNSTEYYIGSEWTIETITEHFEELGFTNVRAVPCDPDDDNYKVNIREMVIETGWFSTDPWEAGDEFAPDAEISIYYNEFPLLTVENCPDLATVLTSKDMDYMTFCEMYDGRYVEFEAYVVGHLTYDGGTSHIIDVTGGDYDGQTEIDAFDHSTFDGLIIRIGDRTSGNDINKGVEVGDHVFVSGRINAGQAEYFKCLYVETMELSRR